MADPGACKTITDPKGSQPGGQSPMLRASAIFLSVCFGLLSLQCATYWQNRGRDTGDLMSAGVQDQSYGMSLRFGPVKAGIHHKSAEGRDMGLRQGYVDRFQSESFVALILGSDILKGPLPQEGPDQSKPDETREKSNGPAATEDRKPSGGQNIDGPSDTASPEGATLSPEQLQQLETLKRMELEDIKKLPAFQNLSPDQQKQFIEQFKKLKESDSSNLEQDARKDSRPVPPSPMEIRGKTYRARSPLGTSVPFKEKNPLLKPGKEGSVSRGFASASYLTSVEIKLGLYGGVYFAIHLGEFVDLLAGLVGLDPMNDDGPFEDGLSRSDLEGLSDDERALLKQLTPEQREQFLKLDAEQRRQLIERQKNAP